jgi:hypothetical protein
MNKLVFHSVFSSRNFHQSGALLHEYTCTVVTINKLGQFTEEAILVNPRGFRILSFWGLLHSILELINFQNSKFGISGQYIIIYCPFRLGLITLQKLKSITQVLAHGYFSILKLQKGKLDIIKVLGFITFKKIQITGKQN